MQCIASAEVLSYLEMSILWEKDGWIRLRDKKEAADGKRRTDYSSLRKQRNGWIYEGKNKQTAQYFAENAGST